MKNLSREEHLAEIQRVKTALEKTNSRNLKHDYGKYLNRLYRDLRYYNRNYGKRTESEAK